MKEVTENMKIYKDYQIQSSRIKSQEDRIHSTLRFTFSHIMIYINMSITTIILCINMIKIILGYWELISAYSISYGTIIKINESMYFQIIRKLRLNILKNYWYSLLFEKIIQ